MIFVYKYGLLPPRENSALVREQMRLAHRYRNTLVEIERGRRAARRLIASQHGDIAAREADAVKADTVVGDAIRAVKQHKSEHRTTKIPEELRATLDSARIAKRDAGALLREARRAMREDTSMQAAMDEIEERAGELRRSARAYCGVYWGTYLLIENEMEASSKLPLYDGVEPNDPKFVRWNGEGSVGVQIQKGMTSEELTDDTRLRIEQTDDPRTGRRAGTRRLLKMRVGSTPDKSPIWALWPMTMHRPLPEGAVIKRATVHLRMIGPREEWSVTLTISAERVRAPARRASAVAVDLGWRVTDDGIRIGKWYGADGRAGEIALPQRMIEGLRKPEELRSIRDERFNLAHTSLAQWLESSAVAVPEWFRESTHTLGSWRSAGRLASLCRRWKTNRFPGDDEGYAALERWRYRDHHLWEWETSQRTGSLRYRREIYRMASASLAAQYEKVIIEDFDLRQPAKRVAVDAPRDNEGARSNRQLVAPSELIGALKNAFRGDVELVSPENTTKICHGCGSVEHWDQASEVIHACRGCGDIWDQDDNAAKNIFERWSAGPKPGGARTEKSLPITAISESRWERARRLKNEKQERKTTAREPLRDAAE